MVYSTNILLAIVTLLTAVFIWSRRTYVYWQRRRVKFVQPTHILGNLKKVLKLEESFALQLRRFYFNDRFRNEPVVGIYLFHQPALLIRDLQLVRTVLVEDFVSFSNRFAKCDMRHDKMGSLNLFFARQPEWREIRTRLSPVFTGAKIKQMFSLMEEVSPKHKIHCATKTGLGSSNACGILISLFSLFSFIPRRAFFLPTSSAIATITYAYHVIFAYF